MIVQKKSHLPGKIFFIQIRNQGFAKNPPEIWLGFQINENYLQAMKRRVMLLVLHEFASAM